MHARGRAFGWASIYGPAWGLSGAAWQDAAAGGRTGWAVVFAGYTIGTVPVFFALQWRELMP